ncbi:PAS domain-containing protein [Hyalangium sp.]|uniref:PAS domain-containing protein n=1 Tax=Hyalangium sp. TaxID=2028555 RepID=UPI002D29987E|nr:PAS domain-containing protein [Hyalangium sp.]HYI01058.1 PAS domain-containing protein [Hyalangium sp.]
MPERLSHPPPSRAPARVWLVEDNLLDTQRTLALLGRFYAVTHFGDAASMLERLSDEPPPDLLLLDWQLPGVSGLDACRFVREQHDEAALPVLMLTVRGAREDFREGLQAGANDYVAKPYDETEFLARVRTLLRMRRAIADARSSQALAEATQAELDAERVHLRDLFENAPAIVCVLREPGHVFQMANPLYRRVIAGERQLVGLPVREALPEVVNQGFIRLLDEVYRTGVPFVGHEMPLRLDRHGNGQLEDTFFTFVYQPTHDAQGNVDGIAVFGFEVTEQVVARRRAEAATAQLEAIFQSIPDALYVGGPSGIHRANAAALDMLGYDSVEALNRNIGTLAEEIRTRRVDTGEIIPEEGQAFTSALRGQPDVQEVLVRNLRTGEDRVVRSSCAPIRVGTEVVGAVAINVDITERRRMEEALRKSEEHLRRVAEATGVGTWELELRTRHILADARMRELFWLAPDGPLTQEAVFEAVHPENRKQVVEAVTQALAGAREGRYALEYRLRNTDGHQRWVEARGRAYFDAASKPVRFLGTVVDISPRKEAESAQAEFLQALMSQPLLGVAIFRGPHHVFETANAPYQQMVGSRDVVGKPMLEALPELKGQGFDTLLTRVMQTGEPFVGRETPVVLGRHGAERLEQAFFNFVYQPMRGREGLSDGVLVVAQDVTDLVRARHDAERLAQESKGRSDFEQQLIGIVSHDLRNPLQAIHLGVMSLLRQDDLSERQTKVTVRIQSSVERASRMIRDLLDFTQARLGSGIRLERRPTDLFDVVRNVLQEVEAIYPDREVRLRQEGDGKGSWDADRLSQAVQNLVTNALKYSPEGTPVAVTMRGEPGHIVLQVQNAGAPIPSELLPRIFEPLQRATADVDKQGRSVGLGLYIVKHLVEAHAGTVEVKSSEAEGTTFQVRLPRSASGAAS